MKNKPCLELDTDPPVEIICEQVDCSNLDLFSPHVHLNKIGELALILVP